MTVVKKIDFVAKFRVVFDGSAKTANGVSLNDNLLSGPKLQQNLFSILVRFRSHRYVLSADISKMYRQILVDPVDRDFQRILWRDNQNKSIQIWKLKTVTYGTTFAPFLAIRCLQQLALEEKSEYPLAYSAIINDFHVDDLLTGADDLTDSVYISGHRIIRT